MEMKLFRSNRQNQIENIILEFWNFFIHVYTFYSFANCFIYLFFYSMECGIGGKDVYRIIATKDVAQDIAGIQDTIVTQIKQIPEVFVSLSLRSRPAFTELIFQRALIKTKRKETAIIRSKLYKGCSMNLWVAEFLLQYL